MSDRTAVPPDQQTVQKLREIDDRLRTLETRGVPGNVALSTATVGDLSVAASATTPLRLNGSADWTMAVESFRQPGVAPVAGITGDDALVIRNENGAVRDMFPRQYAFLGAGAAQSIPTSTATVLSFAGAGGNSSPYPAAAATAAAQLLIPLSGVYDLLYAGVWGALADATVRLLAIESSTNGGVSWATLFAVDQANLNHAGFGQLQSVVGTAALTAGTRLRMNVDQRSAGALNHTPQVFSAMFLRGEH